MTQWYSHLAPDTLRGAVNILEEAMKSKKEDKDAEVVSIDKGA